MPRNHRSRMMAATCLPLPQPVPSPSIQPRRKRTGSDSTSSSPAASLPSSSSSVAVEALHRLPAGADAVEGGEVAVQGLAGEDDALELGVGELTLGHDPRRQHRTIRERRVRHGGHGARLNQCGVGWATAPGTWMARGRQDSWGPDA